MLSNTLTQMIASFTSPEHISVNPYTLLWMLPLLLGISIVYKTTKLKVFFWKKLVKEVAILMTTSIVFITLTALAIWGIIEIFN